MWKKKIVRVIKSSATKSPGYETPSWSIWENSVRNVSVPNGYWAEGEIIGDIELGKPMVVYGVTYGNSEHAGYFSTSPISSLGVLSQNSIRVETRNSIYIVTNIGDPKENYNQKGESSYEPS